MSYADQSYSPYYSAGIGNARKIHMPFSILYKKKWKTNLSISTDLYSYQHKTVFSASQLLNLLNDILYKHAISFCFVYVGHFLCQRC